MAPFQVVVPPGTNGLDLLRLNARKLTELVETEQVIYITVI